MIHVQIYEKYTAGVFVGMNFFCLDDGYFKHTKTFVRPQDNESSGSESKVPDQFVYPGPEGSELIVLVPRRSGEILVSC